MGVTPPSAYCGAKLVEAVGVDPDFVAREFKGVHTHLGGVGGDFALATGDTIVLCTAVGERKPRPGVDFFPLTVNYQEKTLPAGKSPAASSSARAGRPKRKC